MAHDVFISYSHTDKPTADAACATLESRGVRCWIAPRDVLPGEEYASALVTAIHSSRLLVLVFSSGANQSPQVLREVERAVSKGLPILPLRIEDVAPSAAMEYYISSRHWLDALTTPLEQHLVQLADTVTLLLARSPGGSAPPAPPQAVKPVPPPQAEVHEAPRAAQAPPPPNVPTEQPRVAAPPKRPEKARLDPRLSEGPRIAMAGVLVLAILGVSTRVAPQLQYMFGWSNTQVTVASVLRLLLLALGFAAGGLGLRRTSPRRIVTLAGLLCGLGALVAGILLPLSPVAFIVYVLAIGLAAVGSGLGFVAVVATLLKWFPGRHGMIAGIASAAWFAGVAPAGRVFDYFGMRWLVLLGLGSLVVVTLAARVLHDPEPPAPGQPSIQPPLTAPPWYALWILLFANTLAGAITITALGAVATAETIVAPWLLDVLMVCMALGCFAWGVLSDRLGRRRVLLTVLVIQGLLLLAVPGAIRVAATPVLMVVIFLANGGGFSSIAAAAADHFASDVGARYGVLLSAWCLGLLGSAALARLVRENYPVDFRLAAGIALVAAVIAFRLRPADAPA